LDNALRLQYLEAMGIDVWLPRFSDQSTLDLALKNDPVETESTLLMDNWTTLQAEITNCRQCALCTSRSQSIVGAGNLHANWMFVGNSPDQQEDEQGLPFVANSGLLFTEMLRAIGLKREEVFMTNIIKCKPTNDLDLYSEALTRCKNYLHRQQQLINPKIIVALGDIAAQTLLGTDKPFSELRGKVGFFNNTPVVVAYHPAYLLKSLPEKNKAWMDLIYAVQTFNNTEG